ncbi:MAG: hypothetical protein A2096_01690 [Spirochaetes bacterium GWF1_41_5]|nr:MAG: hypothetical protein A2096_01690 [Spirochaetes bacterium GWF1_41_5]
MAKKYFPSPGQLAAEKALQKKYPAYAGVDEDYLHAGEAAIERMLDWKFGIRIHWSIYSITGSGHESWPLGTAQANGTPAFRAQYEELYKWWNPSRFSAEEWTDMMLKAGLKFFSFTAKHHDGFSMYNTKTKVRRRMMHAGPAAGKIVDCNLSYSIMETPFKRDVVKELTEAARKKGLGIGIYFSHIDWFDSDFRIDEWNYQKDEEYSPDKTNFTPEHERYIKENDPEGFKRMIARHREQIRELLTNYGKIDMLCFDMNFPDNGRTHGIREDLVETVKMARKIQSEVLMRRRGIDPYGDYRTPERVIPADKNQSKGNAMPWMVIYPGSRHFSHIWGDEYKPAKWIINSLIEVTAKGGNFQVGYGPGPDGTFDAEIIRRLEKTGKWLKINGEGIYCTRPYKIVQDGENLFYTRSKNHKYVYAFLTDVPGAPFCGGRLCFPSVHAKKKSRISILGMDYNFKWEQNDHGLMIDIPDWFNNPEKQPCEFACGFKIEQTGKL